MTFGKPLIIAGFVLATFVGCGDSSFPLAPVSGTITLDGQPVANAKIGFAPTEMNEMQEVGPGSVGRTDDEGRYSLKTFEGKRGAVVGKHLVSISTREIKEDETTGSAEVIATERIPPKYRRRGELTFEVPAKGSEQADFALATD